MKGALGLRPVLHHREDRIRAHIQLCWLALLLIRMVENATADTWRNPRTDIRLFVLFVGVVPWEQGSGGPCRVLAQT